MEDDACEISSWDWQPRFMSAPFVLEWRPPRDVVWVRCHKRCWYVCRCKFRPGTPPEERERIAQSLLEIVNIRWAGEQFKGE